MTKNRYKAKQMRADKPAMMMAGLFNLYDSIQRNSKSQYIVIFNGTTSQNWELTLQKLCGPKIFSSFGTTMSPLISDLANLYLKTECGKWGIISAFPKMSNYAFNYEAITRRYSITNSTGPDFKATNCRWARHFKQPI